MARGIFLIGGDNTLTELREQPYDSERLLQQLLADHPGILAGEDGDVGEPRRWLLISREAAIADSPEGSGRWSIDHVFLDQQAVPTLVEVKRSSDTRIRREVVGQMLDYAANIHAHWSPEHIRAVYDARCAQAGRDPIEEVRMFVAEGSEPDAFWDRVSTNMKAGRLRLVFVADEIPNELRLIIEFLNDQMSRTEVLGIEVRQYVGSGLRTLVPTIVGQTAEAQQRKSPARASEPWDESRFMSTLSDQFDDRSVQAARAILQWAKRRATRVWWGKGERWGSFVPMLVHDGVQHQVFALYTSGSFEVYFQHYAAKRPFDDESRRRELWSRLNSVPGIALPEDSLRRRPSIPLTALAEGRTLEGVLAVFDWFIGEIRAT